MPHQPTLPRQPTLPPPHPALAQPHPVQPPFSPQGSLSGPQYQGYRYPHSGQPPPAKSPRVGEPQSRPLESKLGFPGFPEPSDLAPPKARFSAEDDQKLKLLKEEKGLSWKQIKEFFPGRASGTLQVRYCTKLKVKEMQWNSDLDAKLKKEIAAVEEDKWNQVANKMGKNFSAAGCEERWKELQEHEDLSDEDDDRATPGGR